MKQRLVGAIVLGCLAIIFIPILLDGEGVPVPQTGSIIPPSPSVPDVPDINPVRPVILSDTDAINIPQPDFDKTGEADRVESNLPAATPQLNAAGIPISWSVRLGAFEDVANAEALVGRLLQNGYRAYKRPLESNRGGLTGVYVGPVLTTTDVNALQQELESEFNLSGIVEEFSIEELEE